MNEAGWRSDNAGRVTRATSAPVRTRRVAVLRYRDFRRFFAGYSTSLLGSSMSVVAVTFAVLGSGGSADDLGLVMAARIAPQVLLVLGGGVLADRIGRRTVMLA